ncbi:NAD kinase-like isoform X4 [Lycorma delicatula]|uniref:NAD kinase-like isoform X4 n=1 Tax=Lycorma delicatula TaxID=130591 RepID=UPI003F518148
MKLGKSARFKSTMSTSANNQLSNRKTFSLNAPSPVLEFGPCGRVMKNSAMVMTIQDPASQRLTWHKPPMTVLVIKKIRDVSVLQPFIQLIKWLIEVKRMAVFVEGSVLKESLLIDNDEFSPLKNSLRTFHDRKDDLTDKIDFIICLGGDGTLLYASMLFQQSVPPVMAFHLGSLGFLTPFNFDRFEEHVTEVLEGLIISTSTGSTAYAVAAGASMIHPSVSAIMITPICPHSLSFRPIVVPAGIELQASISSESRNTAWVSFDGHSRQELLIGESLSVTTSIYPVPSISAHDQISDWFASLGECLHWNMRKRQKSLDMAELTSIPELPDSIGNNSLNFLEKLQAQLDI